MSAKITWVRGAIQYEWIGGLDCWFRTYETRRVEGDLRLVNGIVFQAYIVGLPSSWTGLSQVDWTPAKREENTSEEMRMFKGVL